MLKTSMALTFSRLALLGRLPAWCGTDEMVSVEFVPVQKRGPVAIPSIHRPLRMLSQVRQVCPAGHRRFRKRHFLTSSQQGLIRTSCCNFSNASIAAYQSDGLEPTAALDLTEGYNFAKWRKPVQTLPQRLPQTIVGMTFAFLLRTLIPQPMTGPAWTNLYRLLSASYSANAQLPYRVLQKYERAISFKFV
jgi:hypothetical protein